MTAQDSFLQLKNFFESRESARIAMSAIKENIEISIIIGETVPCALFRRGDQPVVEQREAHHPDVIFHIVPESIEVLSGQTKDQIGQVGVNVLTEVLAGNIRIEVPGRIWNLIGNGYLETLRKGGAPVAAFLAQHGLSSASRIIAAIRKLKG